MAFKSIIRKFFPVGQGAFYSERIENGKDSFIIVYDCGVDHVHETNQAIVLDAFSKKDTIDYLFISHLDKDHISLVKTLKESVKRIQHVVLPLIDEINVRTLYSLSMLSGDSDVASFWEMVRSSLSGEGIEEGSPRIFFITPEGIESDIRETQWVEPRPTGYPIDSYDLQHDDLCWVFIPFCQHQERKNELDARLENLLEDSEFASALLSLKIKCSSLYELKYLLSTHRFADLISNSVIREKLHEAYSSITGSINQNSLLVYSGPDSESDILRIDSFFPQRCSLFRHYCSFDDIYHRVACLFTGDSDLDMYYYKNHLADLWENVGTIQLPHHGSHNSFKAGYNMHKFDRPYLFPVSFGEKNNHHHPSGKVLSFLLSADCIPIPVTDNYNTLFIQEILFDHVSP